MAERILKIFLGKGIAEVYHARNKLPSALTDIYAEGFIHLCLAVPTSELGHIAMELRQQLRTNSGTEVKVIDILGDEEFQLTQVL
jgi:hypothetical protein